ncbi:glycosyltransferase family 4 protein [Dactylosporangium sp. NPDC005555]|uniref:glycosyltransferase family 4 protein n=1 Tax=Dactylosporangium sp. NPDC005555 TaxID=3154889 RepID=UPI00339F2284
MRIGIVSQWFPPEPAFIPGSLAGELARRGHDVRVLTGFPNYPGGVLYPGFRQRWRHRQRQDGVTVRRVPLFASHDNSGLRRAANYLSFAASSSAAALPYLRDADVLYVYHPPATAAAAALLVHLARRTPLVLHVQDVWPDAVTASTMAPSGTAGRLLHGALGTVMRHLYATAAAVVVIAPGLRDLLIDRGVDPAKVHTSLNWTDETVFRPAPPAAAGDLVRPGRCTVMYAGNLGHFQGLDTAVRAARATDRDGVDLLLVGSGVQETRLRALAADLGTGNVRFAGRRPAAHVAGLHASADFQLVSLRALPLLSAVIPSKLPAALACAAPVIVSAAGDAANIVHDAGAGLVCPPEDTDALAQRFLDAAAMPVDGRRAAGERARVAYQTDMRMQLGVDRIERLLTSAARRDTPVVTGR